jgi:Zn-dependent metalloprotease
VFDPASFAARSMEHPSQVCSDQLGCHPDHYDTRYLGRRDNGGVHVNSAIANQAFYLLVEGGTNRTSRMRVEGIGTAKRERAEKIFYRGFTAYLTPRATFADAREATVQAARDLYGADSAEVREVSAAWTAVGVE